MPLIQAIVDLAHGLGLTVIAEGVETERQFDALAAAQCDQVQGYFIHRPQPPSQMEAAFRRYLPDVARLGLALKDGVEVPMVVAPVPTSLDDALTHRGSNLR